MIISIKKRDGRVVPFDPSKIEHAIADCFMGSGSQTSDETAQELAALVVSQLENDENIPSVPSVEQVQDVVERVLIEKGFVRSAKAYILYRAERSRVREMNTRLMKVFEDIASKDAVDSDIKRENANINGDTAMGTMLKYGPPPAARSTCWICSTAASPPVTACCGSPTTSTAIPRWPALPFRPTRTTSTAARAS